MLTQEELLQKIKEAAVEQKDARNQLAALKRQCLDAETHLIHCNLNYERLVEDLRVCRNTTVSYELTEREKDIERFRQVLPDLINRKP